jgi:exosortase/archaeosortase family protein
MSGVFSDKKFWGFILKFGLVFCVLYLGSLAIIGLSSPEGYYSPFVATYLDYISGIKNALIFCTRASLHLFGIQTVQGNNFSVGFLNGRSVRIAMNCVGYGVYSFWIAYVVANVVPAGKKIIWAVGGVLLLFIINDIRITLFLTSINKGWPMPLGIDHHTWFNIFAYIAIFVMIYFFEKMLKKRGRLVEPGLNMSELST